MNIKQALKVLEREGAVQIQKFRGDYVVTFSYFDEDIFLDVRKTFREYNVYLEWRGL